MKAAHIKKADPEVGAGFFTAGLHQAMAWSGRSLP